MAAVEGGAGFWLPSEFFDDSLILNNKENLYKNSICDSDFCFPKDFPYDFHGETLPHFEKKRWAMSTSPQSTLTHGRCWSGSSNSSPDGVYSPPTMLDVEIDAVGDLIYRAAGQVAKLKLNTTDKHDPTKHEVFMAPPRAHNQFHAAPKNSNQAFFQNVYLQQHIMKQQKQGSRVWYAEPQLYQMRSGRPVGGLEGWSMKHNPGRVAGEAVLGGAAAKRARAGTGVFLPRRYGSGYESDPRKKTGSGFVPDRNAHAHGPNNSNGFGQPLPKCGSRGGIISEYDLVMGRRNALMLQHRRSLLLDQSPQMTCGSSGGVCLPQEWTY